MPTPTRFTVAAVSTVPFPSLTLTADAEAVRDAAALLGKSVEVTDPSAAAVDGGPQSRRAVAERALDLLERFGFASADLTLLRDYTNGSFSASSQVGNAEEFRTIFAGRTATASSGGYGWVSVTVTIDGVEFHAGWSHPKVTFKVADWIVGTPLPMPEPDAGLAAAPAAEPGPAADTSDVDVVF